MLNLLFISNSPKVQYIKSVLQPVLKVIIDVVPDFDHGLKDVFEKRPNTVCIQEQISGVTGESVARHIQMLLGSGAPKFILMHEGSSKVKIIKGLFEYIVDLNQPDDVLAENFQETLKTLLGEQWTKIAVAPELPSLGSFLDSEDALADADKMIDDFLSDLENSNFSSAKVAAEQAPTAFGSDLLSSSDEIAELLVAQSSLAKQDELAPSNQNNIDVKPAIETVVPDKTPQAPLPEVAASPSRLPEKFSDSDLNPQKSIVASTMVNSAKKTEITEPDLSVKNRLNKDAIVKPLVVAPVTDFKQLPSIDDVNLPPTDSVIISKDENTEEKIPNDLLRAFEKNYRSEKSHTTRNIAIGSFLLVSVAVTGWFLLNSDSQFVNSLKNKFSSSKAVIEGPTQPGATVKKNEVVNSPPSFIPSSGHDKAYSLKNPGWDKYTGGDYEIRVFKKAGEIKAVQVLSVKAEPITQDYLNSAFKEITGTAEIKVSGKKVKSGLTELRGVTGRNADFVIYKKGNSIRAFVLSLKQ